MTDIESFIPDILNNIYCLHPLEKHSAKEAIKYPAKVVGMECEDAFIKNVLLDLDQKGINPPQLQIVCTAVLNAMSVTDKKINLNTYNEIGRAKTILSTYFKDVLSVFKENQKNIARDLLKCFVDHSGTGKLINEEVLYDQIMSIHEKSLVLEVLNSLTYKRLIRVVRRHESTSYELAHDYLIQEIDLWITDEERDLQRIKEIMNYENWICDYFSMPIPFERAKFLNKYIERASINNTNQELIKKSIKEFQANEKIVQNLETALRQAQKMESIGTLVAGIAHDFNNILAAIMGFSEIVKIKLEEDHPAQEDIDQVIVGGNRARDLIMQLLSFSRQTNHEKRAIKIAPIIKEALKMIRAMIPTSIKIRQNINEKIPAVKADPTEIHQILLNLCTNAFHAMEANKGGVLDVSLESVNIDTEIAKTNPEFKPGRYNRISVKDNGCGMDRATIEQIFEPYFTTKENGKGTGIGLAVTYGIIESYGGTITVNSEKGKGTNINVFLPILETEITSKVIKEM